MLGCSWRTVLRLADAGNIPPGCKLGALRRWDLSEIEAFIAAGCKLAHRQRERGAILSARKKLADILENSAREKFGQVWNRPERLTT